MQLANLGERKLYGRTTVMEGSFFDGLGKSARPAEVCLEVKVNIKKSLARKGVLCLLQL